MNTFIGELRRTFPRIAYKRVTRTDIAKNAYLPDEDQRAVLALAGHTPGLYTEERMVTLHILSSNRTLEASYYQSVREGSGRTPEPRMGRFIHWLEVGDRLLFATDGTKVFVHKLTDEDMNMPQDIREHIDRTAKVLSQIDRSVLLERARSADPQPKPREATTFVYDRDPAVKAYVIVRSGYCCEMPECKFKGFIKTDGNPYIETHHIVPLGEEGEDSILNGAALCPNCHRKAHYSARKGDLAKILLETVARKTT